MKQDVVFVHGWGFNPDVWQGIVELWPDITPHYVDLGFVGGFENAAQNLPKNAVVVGHSLGVLWLLKHGPRPFKAFVSIAGFDVFSNRVPVKLMKRRLDRDAYVQMQEFWQAVGVDDFCDENQLNIDQLKEGLEWLMVWDAKHEYKSLTCVVLALAGRQDVIVPHVMQGAILHEDAGHALPISHPAWCVEMIMKFLRDHA
jgi:pimeloyl-[acyl-carrier protein] methyl ester esterase